MSGELYSIWNTVRFDAFETCPEELEGRIVTLRSSEGKTFEVDAEAVCMSHSLLAELLQQSENGTLHEDIVLPFKTKVLTKVVEYLQYHQEYLPGELETPFRGETLLDCGASKWDATFVNVDRDMFFELMLAANMLQIGSLVLLTSAKAAMMVRGKDSSKIRKDFSFKNDFPGEEDEEELREKYVIAMKKLGLIRDDQDLSGGAGTIAGILQGVVSAAISNGILEEAETRKENYVSKRDKSWSIANWRALVLADWRLLADAPLEVKSDPELMYAAVSASGGKAAKYAADALLSNSHFILHVIKYDPTFLLEASRELRENRDFVLDALMVNGEAFVGASVDFRRDQEFVMTALKRGGQSVLQGAAEDVRANEDFVLSCMRYDSKSYKGAATQLQSSRDFALKAVQVNGHALGYMSSEFKADLEICQAAVSNTAEAIIFVHSSRRHDLNLDLPWDTELVHKQKHEVELSCGVGQTNVDPMDYRIQGVPLTREAKAAGLQYRNCLPLQKIVVFSAANTMTANMGQSNYISSNSLLDKFVGYQRPTVDGISLMWGPVGGIGMRLKAFASADFMLAQPELLMSVDDARMMLFLTCCVMDPPEWYNVCFMDQYGREAFLSPTAGTFKAPAESYQSLLPPPAIEQCRQPKAQEREDKEPEQKSVPRSQGCTDGGWSDPLSGWPKLTGQEKQVPCEVAEGAHVKLTGLNNSKNGLTGIATKQMPDGKWKVELDNGTGKALMKVDFLQIIDTETAVKIAKTASASQNTTGSDTKAAVAAKRRQDIELRRGRLKEKTRAKAA